MAREINPLTANDIPELSRFLTTGFHTSPDADYAAPDVLRWKYLEPDEPRNEKGIDSGPIVACSYLARDETGAIIGHLGLCRTFFEGQALSTHGGRVSTIHIIDWLGSPEHRAVGASLMRKAHEGVATQFGLGVSQAALVVGERIGYELRDLVPVYTRVLRGGYWMRSNQSSPISRLLRAVRDIVTRWVQQPIAPRVTIKISRVSHFGTEIDSIIAHARTYAILTGREPARLNKMLRFPRQEMSGWHLEDATGRLCGFALLNVISTDQGRTRTGKIVDCLLDDINIDQWHAAMLVLANELARQGADLVQAYASTPWTGEALRQSGFRSRFGVKFHIRDRQRLIPHGAIFHLTPLEGDYAYT